MAAVTLYRQWLRNDRCENNIEDMCDSNAIRRYVVYRSSHEKWDFLSSVGSHCAVNLSIQLKYVHVSTACVLAEREVEAHTPVRRRTLNH